MKHTWVEKFRNKLHNYPFKPKINNNIDIDDESRLDIHDYLQKKGLETKQKIINMGLSKKYEKSMLDKFLRVKSPLKSSGSNENLYDRL